MLTSQVLQLNSPDLEQAVESELVENPALEKIDDFEEPLTHDEILRAVAPQELKPHGEDRELTRSMPNDAACETDWVDLTASNDTLWDHLRAQLLCQIPPHLEGLAVYLVGSVNERGYLTCGPEEAALDTGCALEEAEDAIRALQTCEPPGVGARDLQECLRLQLRRAETDAERLARRMLKHDWDDLVARNGRAIARRYGATLERVEEAFEVILGLTPFPGEGFTSHRESLKRPVRAVAVPDVIVTLEETGWLIEVPGPSPLNLRVNPTYEKRSQELEEMARPPRDERRHVIEYVERARRFLDALGQRRRQLARVARYLVEHQAGFVKTGEYRFLAPLTRTQMAKDLGVHESTISRATNGKFIQIANREVVSFDVFFKPALRVQKMIEEILTHENPDNPLSDESIAQLLLQRGVKVARRTVNKYRDRTKLLSSRRRKTA